MMDLRKHSRLALASCLLAGLAATPVHARNFEDFASLDALVATTTGAEIGKPGGAAKPIDRRFRLAPCRVPAQAEYHGKTRASLKVWCPDPGGWSLFVPLVPRTDETPAVPGVLRGDTVAVQLRGRGFTLSARGEAMAAAGQGETVTVRLTSVDRKAKRVTATVIAPGTVAIDLP